MDELNQIYNKAAIKCLGNAYDLSESAELLFASGKTGIAVSLMVLACEEMAKGQHYRSFAEGLTTTDVRMIGKIWVFDKKVIYEHELKQMYSTASGIIQPFFDVVKRKKDKIDAAFLSLDLPDDPSVPLLPETEEKMKIIFEKFFDSDQEFRKISTNLRSLMERMEGLKEQGLYVDIKDGKILSPAGISKDDFMLLRNHFNHLVISFGGSIAGIGQFEKGTFHMKFLNNLAKSQKKPSFESYRRGSLSKKKLDH